MLKEFDLAGKTAIVTGAARGVGKGIALTLADAGADVVVTDILPEIEETRTEIQDMGRRSLAIPTDVRQTAQVDAMVEATVAEFGKVDILVSNAGIDIKKPLILVEGDSPLRMRADAHFDSPLLEDEWEAMLDINLKGYVRCAIAVGRHMIKQKSGRIIGIGSVAGLMAGDIGTIYAASKAGVHRFSQALSREWAPFNITVNCIAPGAFGPTESWYVPSWNISREEHEESFKRVIRSVPLKRFGDTRELGMLTVFLASEAGSYVTGQVIAHDGGISA
jgi:NAD(P)-dependent dehydrogenase (short-subunit alcohol dehydrogenase family)